MKKKLVMIFLSIILVTPLVGYSASNTSTDSQQSTKSQKKPLYWVDSMEPNIHYPGPGKSRMGMELVPVYPDLSTVVDKASATTPGKE
jgi:Cu(I)/Ag(I) efflux system membrane fusion protein